MAGLSAPSTSTGSYTVSWTQPSSAFIPGRGYTLRESTDGGTNWTGSYATGTSRSKSFTGKASGTYTYDLHYCFQIIFLGVSEVCGTTKLLNNWPYATVTVSAPNLTPTLPAVSNKTCTRDSSCTVNLTTASGGDPPLSYTLTGTVPPGMAYQASNKRVSGTPSQTGSWTLTWKVEDDDGDVASDAFTITVQAPNLTPTLPGVSNKTCTRDSSCTVNLTTASGGDPPLSYTLTGTVPPGMAYQASNKRVTGTPSQTGSWTLTWKVEDDDGDVASDAFTITVQAPDLKPTLPGVSNKTCTRDSSCTVNLTTASGGDPPLSYTLTGTVPPGMAYQASNKWVSGTPSQTGSWTLTWKVEDDDGDVASDAFTITVQAPDLKPTLPGVSNKTCTRDSSCTVNLTTASGGDPPLSYTLTGTVPPGMAYQASNKRVSGTPSQAGSWTLTWKVEDDDGDVASDSFTITVQAPDLRPTLPAVSNKTCTRDNSCTVGLTTASGGDPPLSYTLTGTVPPGMAYQASNKRVSGTPTQAGSWTLTWKVEDTDGDAVSKAFTITVIADTVPSFGTETVGDHRYLKDQAISTLQLPAATGGNGTLTYSLTPALPAGLAFSSANRQVTGTPTAALAATTYTYKAADSDLNTSATDSATLTFKIEVLASGITAPATSTGDYTVSWSQPSYAFMSARGYTLKESTDGGTTWTGSYATGTDQSKSFTGKAAGTYTYDLHYCFWITFLGYGSEVCGTTKLLNQWPYATVTVSGDDLSPTLPDVEDATCTKGSVCTVNLSTATGGDAPLTYTLTGTVPPGMAYQASAKQISGTPTQTGSWPLTWEVEDDDGDSDSSAFTITVQEEDSAPDFGDATVPNKGYVKGLAIATLQLPQATDGNGTLTYSLTPALPAGLAFAPATRRITGTPTATQAATTYTYKVVDADTNTAASDADTLTFNITVAEDAAPSFGSATVPNQTYTKGTAIQALQLPAATGGNGPVTYSLTSDLPAGLTFSAATRRITGTPTVAQAATTYIYKAVDGDTNTADSDADTLTFTIRVVAPPADTAPSFGTGTVPDKGYVKGSAIEALELPEATGGDGTLTYSLTPDLPAGLSFSAATRRITGTPTAAQAATIYTYEVVDSDSNTADSDADTLTFKITVAADTAPDFGTNTVPSQSYVKGLAIDTLQLPTATGGNGALTYSLTPALPAGLTFSATTRQVTGTPTVAKAATTYTYKAVDGDTNTSASDADTLTFTIAVLGAGITVPATSSGDYRVSWTQPSILFLPARGYTLNESTDGGTTWPASYATGEDKFKSFTGKAPGTYTYDLHYCFWITLFNSGTEVCGTTKEFNKWPYATVTVNGGDLTPTLPDVADKTCTQDSACTVDLTTATGGNPPLTHTLTGTVPPGMSYDATSKQVSGTPTEAGSWPLTWKVEDTDGDTDSEDFTITVEATDTAPNFGNETVPDQSYVKDLEIDPLQLPAATGGDGTLTYSLTPVLPAGLAFSAATRQITGTPTATQAATTYTYKVADADTDTSASDEDTLTFTITVGDDSAPSFGAKTVPNKSYVQGQAILTLQLPEATGGNGALTYSLTPALPAGLTFSAATRRIAGTPTAAKAATTYTYKVADADANTVASDADTLTFTIGVIADTAPDFGTKTVPNQSYVQGLAIETLQLPAATGGNGALTYSLTPDLPAGLSFSAATRQVTGTPTAAQAAATYTYKAADADANTVVSDADTLTFTIAVQVGGITAPTTSKGDYTVSWTQPSILFLPSRGYTLHESTDGGTTWPASYATNTDRQKSFTAKAPGTYTYDLHYCFWITLFNSGSEVCGKTSELNKWPYATVTVTGGDLTPTLPEVADKTCTTGSACTVDLGEATGGNSPLTYTLTGTVPPGMSYDATSKQVSGTPTQAGSWELTWKVEDADGDTDSEAFTITVTSDSDTAPDFGEETVPNQNYVNGLEIGTLQLPEATGGDGTLTYSLTPTLPAGLAFSAATRRITGTPTAVQAAKNYTYKVVDSDTNTSATDADTLTFTMAVQAAGITAPAISVGSYTVRWTKPSVAFSPANGYTLKESTDRGTTWSGSYPTGAQQSKSFTGKAPGTYTYDLHYCFTVDFLGTNVVVACGTTSVFNQWPYATVMVSGGSDLTPTLPDVEDKTCTKGSDCAVGLTTATGGDAPLTYTLTGTVPPGMSHDETSNRVSGKPTEEGSWPLTWKVEDDDGDSDSSDFTITVQAEDKAPDFGNKTVEDQRYLRGLEIKALELPKATGGNGALTYSLTPALPAGLKFSSAKRQITGKPTEAQAAKDYTYKVVDADGNTEAEDADTLTFSISVAGREGGLSSPETSTGTHTVSWTEPPLPRLSSGFNVILGYRLLESKDKRKTWTLAGKTLASQRSVTVKDRAPGSYEYDLEYCYIYVPNLSFQKPRNETGGCSYAGTITRKFTHADPLYWPYAETEVLAVPAKPADFAATAGDKRVLLTWRDPSDDSITGYETRHKAGDAFDGNDDLWQAVPNSDDSTVSHAVTGLTNGTEYVFQVRAVNKAGAGYASDAKTATPAKDEAPDFGDATIEDQTYTKGTEIDTLVLPEATGGNGKLTHSLTGSLPKGLAFDAETRQLTGTPTAEQEAVTYTYTAVDGDENEAATDTATLKFTITVNDYGVPDKPTGFEATAGNKRVDLNWSDPSDTGITGYETRHKAGNAFDGNDDDLWTAVPDSGAETTSHAVTGLSNDTEYVFQIRAVNEAGKGNPSDAKTATPTEHEGPTFGDETVADQLYLIGWKIDTLKLPEANGGDGALTYSLEPELPAGLQFHATRRQVTGKPTAEQGATEYTYKAAEESEDDEATQNPASLKFKITVEEDDAPTFGDAKVENQTYTRGSAIEILQLPEARGGNGTLTYSLTGDLPAGLEFNAEMRQLTGTPTTEQEATEYTYKVVDQDQHEKATDGDTLKFTIAVGSDGLPSKPSGFKATAGDKRVDLTWSDPDDDSITHYETRHKAGTAFDAKDDLWTPVPDSDAKTTSHAVTGLTNGTTYVFQVRAVNADGAGESSEPRTAAPVVGYAVEQPPTPNNPKDTIVTDADQKATDRVGSIEGLFRVTETGAASYRIPLPTAAGTAGVVPELALAYDSQAGNGIAGLGFRLEGVSGIARCRQTTLRDGAAKALSWSADDRFCLDGQRLVLASRATDPDQVAGTPTYGAPNTIYRTEVDSGVWVTAKGGTAGNPDYFEARAKDGSVRHYGRTPSNSDTKARLEHAGSTLVWSLRRFTDSVGNPVWYEYANDADGQRLTEVRWAYGSKPGPGKGHNAELTFTYEDRDDPIRGYVAGATLTTAKLLSKVTLRNNVDGAFKEVKTLSLEYELLGDSVLDRTSRLKTIKDCVGSKDGKDLCLPETTFTWPARKSGWQSTAFSTADLSSGRNDLGLLSFLPADINGDGRLDMVWLQWDADISSDPDHHLRYGIFNGTGFAPATFHSESSACTGNCLQRIEYLETPNDGKEPVEVAVLDYNADGRHDVAVWRTFRPGSKVVDTDPQWRVHLSTPQQDGSWRLARKPVETGVSEHRTAFFDVDGDGLADAVSVFNEDFRHVVTEVRHLRRDPSADASSNLAYAFEETPTRLHKEKVRDGAYRLNAAGQVRGGLDFNGDGQADHLAGYLGTKLNVSIPTSAIHLLDGKKVKREEAKAAFISTTLVRWQRAMVSDGGEAKAFGDLFEGYSTKLHPADLNGDGLTDLLREVPVWKDNEIVKYKYHVEISTGTGFSSTGKPEVELNAEDVDVLDFPDYNGDGHPDLVWHDRKARRLYAYLWDPERSTFDTALRRIVKTTDGEDERLDTFADIDGDGGADWLHFDLDKDKRKLYVYRNARSGGLPNAIAGIKNGLGATTTLRYGTLAQSSHYVREQLGGTVTKTVCFNGVFGFQGCRQFEEPNVTPEDVTGFYERLHGGWRLPDGAETLGKLSPVLEMRGAIAVVERVTSTAPTMTTQGAWSTEAKSWVDHYYAGARLQGGGLGLLGFEQLSTHDGQTGIRATTSYRQDFPFVGRPLRTTVRTPQSAEGETGGHLLSDASTQWRAHGFKPSWKAKAAADGTAALGPLVVHAAKATEESYTLAVSGTSGNRKEGEAAGKRYREERTATTVDAWGNAVKVTVEALNAAGTEVFKTETTSNFGPTDPSRRLGRLTGTEVTKSRGNSESTRKTQFAYYGDSGCDLTNAKAKGMLCTETLAPRDKLLERTTKHRYDAFGNLVRSAVTARGDDGKAETRCDVDTAVYDATGRWVRIERDCLGRKVREVTKREDLLGLPTSTRVYLDSAGRAHRTETRAYTRRGVAYFTAAGDGSYATETWGRGTGNHCPERHQAARSADGGGRRRVGELPGRGGPGGARGGAWVRRPLVPPGHGLRRLGPGVLRVSALLGRGDRLRAGGLGEPGAPTEDPLLGEDLPRPAGPPAPHRATGRQQGAHRARRGR